MKSATKKELSAQYKSREVTGGVYAIRNTATGKKYIDAVTDIQTSKNRYEFFIRTNTCPSPRMSQDWAAYGKDGFTFEVLETLEKGDAQTMEDFRKDIRALKEIYLEKTDAAMLY